MSLLAMSFTITFPLPERNWRLSFRNLNIDEYLKGKINRFYSQIIAVLCPYVKVIMSHDHPAQRTLLQHKTGRFTGDRGGFFFKILNVLNFV